MDMNPIASFGPHISITLSPMTISIRPDCTTYMHEPGSPLLKTTLPAAYVTFAPARCANIRMSISAMSTSPCPGMQLRAVPFIHNSVVVRQLPLGRRLNYPWIDKPKSLLGEQAQAAPRRPGGEQDASQGRPRDRAARHSLAVANDALARTGMAKPPGEDRRGLRARRKRRSVRAPHGCRAFERIQAAIRHRESARKQRHDRLSTGRALGARRLH